MKALIILFILFNSINSYAMRCGTQLITEGDSISKAIKYCGKPTFRYQNFFYYQKNSGFQYTLVVGPTGTIKNINVKRS